MAGVDLPKDRVKQIMYAAAESIRGINGVEAMQQALDDATDHLYAHLGKERPVANDQLSDARAAQTALFDQVGALRRDLGELLASAEIAFRERAGDGFPGARLDPDIPPAPRVLGGTELQPMEVRRVMFELERWFARGLADQLRATAKSLTRLVELLDGSDPASAAIIERIRTVIEKIRGSRPTE